MRSQQIKEYAYIISIGLVMLVTLMTVASLCHKMIDKKEIEREKNYEEWQEWSGHDDITYSLYLTLKSSNNLPPKK